MPETAPTHQRLLELIAAMEGQPVTMLVDLVVDRYVTGTPKRISREAPVLILRHQGEHIVPGGGANAVANVVALGGRPRVAGVIGDDESGLALRHALQALGAETDGILVRTGYRTPTKSRILAGARHAIKQQVVRIDIEDHARLGADDITALDAVLRNGPRCRAAVVSDYGYGAVDARLLASVRSCLEPGGIIIGDSRFRLGALTDLDSATPNLEEAEALVGAPLPDSATDAAAAIEDLRARLGMAHLLVTRGSDGMVLATTDGAAVLPVHGTDQVADVTGAGDTVIGTFALALAARATPVEAACLANYAGGVVVMKMGTATLDRGELRAAVIADPVPREKLEWVVS